jgi:hypothetical protein
VRAVGEAALAPTQVRPGTLNARPPPGEQRTVYGDVSGFQLRAGAGKE